MGQSEHPSDPAHTAESGQLSFPGTLPGLTATLDATAGLIRFEWTDAAGNVVRRARLEPTGTRAPSHVLRWVCEPVGLHPGDYCLAAPASARALLKRIFRRYPVADEAIQFGLVTPKDMGPARAGKNYLLKLPDGEDRWEWLNFRIREFAGMLDSWAEPGAETKTHGQITLPPVSYVRHNPLAQRSRPEPARIDTTPIENRLPNLQPLKFEQVRRTSKEPLFNSLMEEHHYLGYEQPVGEHLKYLVWAQGRPVACLAWSSAPRHLGSRDRYIGWSAEARRRNIRFIAYNTRFLILPWVRVPHLASHLLGRMAAVLSDDWYRMYSHPIFFAETCIDPGRFRGTCYRAANWQLLGLTTGRGKNDQTNKPNRPIKEILGLPLTPRFREYLSQL